MLKFVLIKKLIFASKKRKIQKYDKINYLNTILIIIIIIYLMSQQEDHIWVIMGNDGTCHKIDHSTKNQSNDKSKQTNSNKLSSQTSSKATSNHAQPLSGYPGQIASQINPKPTNTSSSSKLDLGVFI